jgi:hypothetical protein
MELFMDDFTVYGPGFGNCMENLETILKQCCEHSIVLKWENAPYGERGN